MRVQQPPWLVVGLGNPGEQYRFTRHNMGFLATDILADEWKIRLNKHKHSAIFGETRQQGKRIMIAQPQTYMNLSGKSVSVLCKWYRIPLAQLIVIYDDIDLPLGKLRVRQEGSAGTHNGMRSVIAELGAQTFARVRIGIGKPPQGWDLADFVTSRFTPAEQEIQLPALRLAAQGVQAIIFSGADAAAKLVNGSVNGQNGGQSNG